MGDLPGHPFRGNQYTVGQSVRRVDDSARGVVTGVVPSVTSGQYVEVKWEPSEQHPQGHVSRVMDRLIEPAAPAPGVSVSRGDYRARTNARTKELRDAFRGYEKGKRAARGKMRGSFGEGGAITWRDSKGNKV